MNNPEATFARLCQGCHGKDGRGNPQKAKSLKIDPELLNLGREEAGKLTRDELRDILLNGRNKTPAYAKKLKTEEIDPVLDYAIQLSSQIRGGR